MAPPPKRPTPPSPRRPSSTTPTPARPRPPAPPSPPSRSSAAPIATHGNLPGPLLPARGSCTVRGNLTPTPGGPHTNLSGFLPTTESGTTLTSVATAPLTAVLPPVIAKQFPPTPILAGGTSK